MISLQNSLNEALKSVGTSNELINNLDSFLKSMRYHGGNGLVTIEASASDAVRFEKTVIDPFFKNSESEVKASRHVVKYVTQYNRAVVVIETGDNKLHYAGDKVPDIKRSSCVTIYAPDPNQSGAIKKMLISMTSEGSSEQDLSYKFSVQFPYWVNTKGSFEKNRFWFSNGRIKICEFADGEQVANWIEQYE